jgi:3-deoxy-D-arabino-heptulosonate 7-phosphate (DAHP) synthase
MDNQLNSIDLVSILSFLLGYQNLLENRQQSAHNDVQAANDAQAQFLLEKLSAQFLAQNKMLEEILAILKGGEKVGN